MRNHLQISIDMENAAFEENGKAEIEAIFKRILSNIPDFNEYPKLDIHGKIQDSNGNGCGHWTLYNEVY